MSQIANELNKFTETKKPVTKLEFTDRLSNPVQVVLNQQIKNELISSQMYKAMACCLDNRGWVNAAKVFFKYGQEELGHMDKVYNYMFDRNCKPVVPDCPIQKLEYADIRDVLTTGLNHEIGVTANWDNISNIALDNKDNTTFEFAKWFLSEQIEEEDKIRGLLYLLDKGMPDWRLEEYFADMIK
jgi:ferritin